MENKPKINIGAAFDIPQPSKDGRGVEVIITDKLVCTYDHGEFGGESIRLLTTQESVDKRLKVHPAFAVSKVWLSKLPIKTLPLYKTKVKKVKSRAKSKRRYMVKSYITKPKVVQHDYKWLDKDRTYPSLGIDLDYMAMFRESRQRMLGAAPYSLDSIMSEDVFKKDKDNG